MDRLPLRAFLPLPRITHRRAVDETRRNGAREKKGKRTRAAAVSSSTESTWARGSRAVLGRTDTHDVKLER